MACEAGRTLTASRLFLSLPQQPWSSRGNDHHALLPDLVVFCFCSHTQHRHTGTVCGLTVVSQNREEALFKVFPVWECGRQAEWPPSLPPPHQAVSAAALLSLTLRGKAGDGSSRENHRLGLPPTPSSIHLVACVTTAFLLLDF